MLISNPLGNYQFIKGSAAFSSAVIADPGHGIVHATLLKPLPIAAGFDFIATYLTKIGRPTQAACASVSSVKNQPSSAALCTWCGVTTPCTTAAARLAPAAAHRTQGNGASAVRLHSRANASAKPYTGTASIRLWTRWCVTTRSMTSPGWCAHGPH